MSRVFPELTQIVHDFQTQWVVTLLEKYPTPADIRRAGAVRLTKINHLTAAKAEKILEAANSSVGTIGGEIGRELVRDAVTNVKASIAAESKFKKLVEKAYDALPEKNLLDSIPGVGKATAAVLTAKIVHISRFETPEKLVGYFGTFPEEKSSGVEPNGESRNGKRRQISKKGKYLWLACRSATCYNPAIKSLYIRKLAEGKTESVALGHAMRKLLHIAFAIMKTEKPFDPKHYDWEKEKPRRHKD